MGELTRYADLSVKRKLCPLIGNKANARIHFV